MAYTKTSLICLLLMIYMGYFHFSKNQLPLKRTFFFNFYFLSAIIVTLFDYITLITVNRMNVVPSFINNLAHTIYILSINIMMYFLYPNIFTEMFVLKDQKTWAKTEEKNSLHISPVTLHML